MPGLSSPIRLIVGLGNPGEEYMHTRHNAGAWFAQEVAILHKADFRRETKFKGFYSHFLYHDEKVHLLIPTTFMNHSGQAVKAICDFYKILPQHILIAHDDLDLSVGDTRLKFGGGHGGHNGLRDIIAHLHTNDFYRLRIGIAHPGDRSGVLDYVLQNPSRADRKIIDATLEKSLSVLDLLLDGKNEKAMQLLHTKENDNGQGKTTSL